jgi:hypothetical protein
LLRPKKPIFICMSGFGDSVPHDGYRSRPVDDRAELLVYNPNPKRDLTVTFLASSTTRAQLSLCAPDLDLTSWSIFPGKNQFCQSLPICLPYGFSKFALVTKRMPQTTAVGRPPLGQVRIARIALTEVTCHKGLTVGGPGRAGIGAVTQ